MTPPPRLSPEISTIESNSIRFADELVFRGSPLHLKGAAGSAAALLAFHLFQRNPVTSHGAPVVIVVSSSDEARSTVDDLRSFAPNSRIGLLPTSELTPYDGARTDRSVTLMRAATLCALDENELDFLVTTAKGWTRKGAPPSLLSKGSLRLKLGQILDPIDMGQRLERGGYGRVPICEDPGTFSVRGEIIDLWPPGRIAPLRLELEFERLHRLRSYDPDTQLSSRSSIVLRNDDTLLVPPAREAVVTRESRKRAHLLMRSLCDEVSLPSTKSRALIEDVESGRLFVGGSGFLPAHAELAALADRLDRKCPIIFDDPARITDAIAEERENAKKSYLAHQGNAQFPLESHYLSDADLDASITDRRTVALHRESVGRAQAQGFLGLCSLPLDAPTLGASSQEPLAKKLQAKRKADGRSAGLDPLVERLEEWQELDYQVILCARAQTQADRLRTLLEHRGLSIKEELPSFGSRRDGGLHIKVAPLARGMVAPFDGLVLLTEEEIFARRLHRQVRKPANSFKHALDDLRALSEGDHVVHVEHGIGRYLGLSHRVVSSIPVDLLVVEYHGGDKLLLPVYRLNQIQKFAGDSAPKLDRLGGQTFAKTKSSVRKKVRVIADQLLRLYAERKELKRTPLPPPDDDYAAFEASFPYEETPDQGAAILDVLKDLQKDTVMDRLVCGDVGFGKTEVALRASFLAAHAGRQVALLCPTTVLAEQHLKTFQDRLGDTGIQVEGISRFQNKKKQLKTTQGLKNGSVDIVVGTHRLLSKDIHFKHLGLVIVDEEQRFGVTHKERLKELRRTVDVLTLSATPIPRTLSLAIGGMRDMSIIATAPQDRRSIRTLTSRFDEELIVDAVRRELSRGGQIYYVYNRVEGIYERAELLRRLIPEAKVCVGHGKMSSRELEKTMVAFVDGDCDILCATTIIESGLDIPRANTIIIDRADMFGLSQLYQIRGRVGRSAERAYCYLLLPPDACLSNEARSRIEALERYTELGSGFHIATMDMELRGAGELLGADQSGFMTQVGFELFSEMLEQASAELSGSSYIQDVDPELSVDVPAFLPESYVEDVGTRLSLYKRYALARDESDIAHLNEELENRFGPPPEEARRFAEVMLLKTELRQLRVLGLSATSISATVHLRHDTPLETQKIISLISSTGGSYKLSPDGRLTRRAKEIPPPADGLIHAKLMLGELAQLTPHLN